MFINATQPGSQDEDSSDINTPIVQRYPPHTCNGKL